MNGDPLETTTDPARVMLLSRVTQAVQRSLAETGSRALVAGEDPNR